jgi:hypothetical protein
MLLLTGALTSKPYAFTSRPWELRSVQSIDTLDGIGSNIRVDFKETEVLRILPRKNSEVNENWISDKIRFFYDGLKRQRLTSPYLKIKGELQPIKWKKAISKFSSLLKVYSFEYGHSKVGIVASSTLDLETLYALRDFSNNYGFSFLGLDKALKLNIDNPLNYKFQSRISDLEKTDFCLFIGTNPRFEASTLNLRFRKIFRKGNTSFSSVGGNFVSTFPINFLGLSSKTLISIAEGRHPICKSLAQAENPTVIFGAKILERVDGFAIHDLLNGLVSTFSTTLNKKLSVNLLHPESNTVGGFELGIKAFTKTDLAKCKLVYTIGIDKPSFFETNVQAFSPPVLVMQSSHGDKNTNLADLILPSYTFVEKTATYYNTEGRPQKTQRALIGPNLSREDWKIVRILFHSLDKVASYETKSQLITEMSKVLPSSYFANSWFDTNSGKRQLSLFEFGSRKVGKIYKSSFKLFIEDFYMTSTLCQSSKIMAKASELLRSYTNNYKFLTWSSINK